MDRYTLSHLSDASLLTNLSALVARDRLTTAEMLAHIAEVDSRRLYQHAPQPSMYAYCVSVLKFSEDAAYKRITAARVARRFPVVFQAVADGRLNLTGILLVAARMKDPKFAELLRASECKNKAQIEKLLAERYPQPDVPARIEPLVASRAQLAPERVVSAAAVKSADPQPEAGRSLEMETQETSQLAPERAGSDAPTPVPPPAASAFPRLKPLSATSYAVQFTMSEASQQKLKRAQELLSHQVAARDLPAILDRALDALIEKLEKRKLGETRKPRAARPTKADSRHIPAEVRRAVRARDGDQCSYVGPDGRRCPARDRLEFDHVDPYCRGGNATVSTVRLLCRAHNQMEAERAYGREFMQRKIESAKDLRAREPVRAAANLPNLTPTRPGAS